MCNVIVVLSYCNLSRCGIKAYKSVVFVGRSGGFSFSFLYEVQNGGSSVFDVCVCYRVLNSVTD